jgi:hypothetical protein
MKKNVLTILLSIFVLSCNSNDNNSGMVNIESTLISKGNLFGNGAEGIIEQNLIIADQISWNNLITQMNSANNVSNSFTETNIDFSEYIVIAVFEQIKVNGGHSLELNIISNSENIIVSVTNLGANGNATALITQPYHIVKIKNSDLPILFE